MKRLIEVEDFHSLSNLEVSRLSLFLAEEQVLSLIEKVNRDFKGQLRAVTSGSGAVDILEDGIDKGWGLQYFLNKWNYSPAQVLAFGDAQNDLEMLELAQYSYAMSNADQEIKQKAKFVAPSNDESGVLQVIESFLEDSLLSK